MLLMCITEVRYCTFLVYIVNSLWKGRVNSYLGHCRINIASNAYAYYGKGAFQKSELAGQTILA